MIRGREHAAAMSDNDDRSAARSGLLRRGDQGGFARLVHEGVGFVEEENARIAVKRPSEGNALCLPG